MKMEKLAGGNIAILRPSGSLIGSQETEVLRKAFADLHEEGNAHAIVDLGRVPYLNSTGIGVLIAAYNDYHRRQGCVKLCNLSNKTENVFVLTKLTQVLDIYPNEKEALASFV